MTSRGSHPATEFTITTRPVIRGEVVGEGDPIVLCHGITATRRYVLHGSRALARAGFRLISYDARGHGTSDPAPPGDGYGYPRLLGDLERVIAEHGGGGRVVLAGHSMGAHTALAYGLAHPERLSALILIGPVYDGQITPQSLQYWDGLAEALEQGGIDGFLDYIDRNQTIDPAWRDSVLRFTRERMSAHRHLEAVVAALREVPGSRPFGTLAELGHLQVPTLLVASGDAADPGHPRAVAELYARSIPGAHLISEEEGSSPLAWQGGRLSRAIAEFCAGADRTKTQE